MLREEGYRVVLVNSNPATIMTDPEFADATYVEPLDVAIAHPHHREGAARRAAADARRPDRAQPRDRARTRRACSTQYGVELIGASVEAIRTAEDRQRFKAAMTGDRARACRASGIAYTRRRGAARSPSEVGYPVIVRPSFILGGGGTGIAHDTDEMRARRRARPRREPDLARSSSSAVVVGWKEYELEVMRDHADNVRGHLLDREPRRRWACTPATRSPSRPRRPSPTSSTSACATPRSRASAASASTPAARTCSSRSNPRQRRAWSSSR